MRTHRKERKFAGMLQVAAKVMCGILFFLRPFPGKKAIKVTKINKMDELAALRCRLAAKRKERNSSEHKADCKWESLHAGWKTV